MDASWPDAIISLLRENVDFPFRPLLGQDHGFIPGAGHPQRSNMNSDSREHRSTYLPMLRIAIEEARQGLAEGGIPIGAALFDRGGKLLGRGHNRRVQENDPSVHGETDAFRKAGRQRSYRDKIMVTTLAPCWYCSGLVRQFGIGTLVVGESVNFRGGIDWLRENGIAIIDLHSQECVELLAKYIAANPAVWHEDIGEE
jgi:cytosine/creatinine deaminase